MIGIHCGLWFVASSDSKKNGLMECEMIWINVYYG